MASRCCVCFDDFSEAQGVFCDHEDRHFLCDGCLDCLVSSTSEAAIHTQRRRRGRIECPVQPCETSYSHRLLASHLSPQSFDRYMQAIFKVVEAEALAASLPASMPHSSSEWIELLRKHVVEEILTLKCQACGQAFVDFDGCFALRCSRCLAGLCAWCGRSCENQTVAHGHVVACPFAPRQNQLYGTQEQFERVTRERRIERLRRFLGEVERQTRERLLDVLQKELVDLGFTSRDALALRPRRFQWWYLSPLLLLLAALLRTWRSPPPEGLADVLAEADEQLQAYLDAARCACRTSLCKLWSDVLDIGFDVFSASPVQVPGEAAWQRVMDEVLFLPFRVQTFLALTTATLVGLCAGLPFAFAGLVLELEVIQHFLRWCYFHGGRWLHVFRLGHDRRSFQKLVQQRGQFTERAAKTGQLKAAQANAATPLAFTSVWHGGVSEAWLLLLGLRWLVRKSREK